jgi:hypothetical protein
MENKEQYVLDVIQYADGSTETVYCYDLNSDDLFIRKTTQSDINWLAHRKRIDAMPDEMSVKLW